MFLRAVLLMAALQGYKASFSDDSCYNYLNVKSFCGNDTMIAHSEGQASCQLIHPDCELAIIEDAGQNAFAYDIIKGYIAKHAFMGLTKETGAANPFFWTNGLEPLAGYGYENWNQGQPTCSHDPLNCAAIITIYGDDNNADLERSKWNNGNCDQPCPFICQCPLQTACGEPHFILNMHGSPLPVCFDYQGKDQDVVQMIYDKENDLVVNAQLKTVGEKDHSYFQAMSVLSTDCNIRVGVNGITANSVNMAWQETAAQKSGQVEYSITKKKELVVAKGDVELRFTRKTNIEHLDFYISNSHGISKNAKGIFGELSKLQVHVDGKANGPVNTEGWMTFPEDRERQPIRVVKKERLGHQVSCWRVGRSGHDMLRGDQKDYIVPGLNFRQLAPRL